MGLRVSPGLVTTAKWLVTLAVLAVGFLVLVWGWQAFNYFAVNRSRGRPPGWYPEIMFWYAFPGLEVGLLIGVTITTLTSGVRRLLRVLCLTVWAENAVNALIILILSISGALI
jgi:hypothetical protein